MSNEIEIGEYVKTKKGFIGKLINIDTKNEAYYLDCGKCVSLVNIIKHSKKIIDLIEEGDYINGVKIDEIIERTETFICFRYIYYLDINDVYTIRKENIKDILTKEQMEANQYVVK